MKRAYLTALVLLVAAGCGGGVKNNYTSKEGKFSLYLPGQGKETNLDVPTPVGNLKLYMVTLELPDKSGVYMASYNDIPTDAKQIVPDKVLDGARDGAIGNMKGKLNNETKITVDAHPDGEFDFDAAGGKGKMRIILVGNRQYQVMAMGPKLPPEADKVLTSFKLEK